MRRWNKSLMGFGPSCCGHTPWRLLSELELRDASSAQPEDFCSGDENVLDNLLGDYWVGPETRRTAGWFYKPGKSCFGNGSDGRPDVSHNVRFVRFHKAVIG